VPRPRARAREQPSLRVLDLGQLSEEEANPAGMSPQKHVGGLNRLGPLPLTARFRRRTNEAKIAA
jgi:hypothetical protein